jgi:hypothetical protein
MQSIVIMIFSVLVLCTLVNMMFVMVGIIPTMGIEPMTFGILGYWNTSLMLR